MTPHYLRQVGLGILSLTGLCLLQNQQVDTLDTTNNLIQNKHLSTNQGWSNDLQTITYNADKGYYDIYFLHSIDGATNPFGEGGQDWAHVTTTDFTSYSQQNSAIAAKGGDSKEGWNSAWTGSIVTNDGNISTTAKNQKVAYFTGISKKTGKQAIYAIASSDGGNHFTKVLNKGKPLLTTDQSYNKTDFRDPYIFYRKDKLIMYVAEGDVIGVYQSKNGIDWSKADPDAESKIHPYTFFKGRSWEGNAPVECPVIKTMTTPDGKEKQVLFFGAKDASHGETTGTYYIVGHLDNNGLFSEETTVQRLDQGSDYYGANFDGSDHIEESQSQLISLGWVGNWNYFTKGIHSDQDAKSDFLSRVGFYSSPRQLELSNDLRIQQKPYYQNKQLQTLHHYTDVSTTHPITSNQISSQDSSGNAILYDLPNQDSSAIYTVNLKHPETLSGNLLIDIWQGKDYVKLKLDLSNGNYTVSSYATELNNSSDESQTASNYYYDGLLGNGQGYAAQTKLDASQSITLTVISDNRSLEFFFPDGSSYTVARFNTSGKQDFKVLTSNHDNQLDLKIATVN
ncbi:glycoside hydrolase family 32 protein [Streptococcus saliviloxodontae]|uniref:Levanbiose-producing levanase n=1 Tax=Streptococcus saliviloxodontae TaxID=1349416 RepID=A0ABS2PL92_9STRE|nr:glycoside hydrolase family 32 protein [Streptococcus saliviloxodontae]MBM7636200.1 levanbiose-producing levanase [Streptococcus saliviloxodontae]